MVDIKEHLQVCFINFLIKKTKYGLSVNGQLTEESHKPVIKEFKRRKDYAGFIDNIWVEDLAEIESLSPNNRNVKYLLWVIDVFNKYAWVKLLKDEKGKTVIWNTMPLYTMFLLK